MTNLTITPADLWLSIQKEAKTEVSVEPFLASFYHSSIINHNDLQSALSFILASKLSDDVMSPVLLRELLEQAMTADPSIIKAACLDILAVRTRDPAVDKYSTVLLYLKGFHALLSHRVAHWMWEQGRRSMASYIQSSVS